MRTPFIFLLLLFTTFALATENSPVCKGCELNGNRHPALVSNHLKMLYALDKRKNRCTAKGKEEFLKWQESARNAFKEILGLTEIAKDNEGHIPKVTLSKEIEEKGDYTIQEGTIETEINVSVAFYILRPKAQTAEPLPLAITPHGHSAIGWKIHAGMAKSRKPDYDVAVQAVKKGYIAIAPVTRGIADTDGTLIKDITKRNQSDCRCHNWQAILGGRSATGERVWDLQKILDWALKLPRVDSKRVLMLGNSGGGRATFNAAAADERISMAIVSCAFNSYVGFNGNLLFCPCNYIPGFIRKFGESWDVGALISPRKLLTVNGKKDKPHNVHEVDHAVNHLKELYKISGFENNYTHLYGEEGHQFYPNLMWPWVKNNQ